MDGPRTIGPGVLELRRRGWMVFSASGALVLAGACGRPVLSLDDVLVRPEDAMRLAAVLEREPIVGMRQDVAGQTVEFLLDERRIGEARTDRAGVATVAYPGQARTGTRATARASLDGRVWTARATVFCWQPQRTAIAVDIDKTISKTEYKQLIFEEGEDESDPIKGSAKALSKLADDYHILYVSARPRFLLEKTRGWLAEHDFPPGPVFTAAGLREMIRYSEFKRRTLHALRKKWPGLLIGIGDKPADALAYGQNKMLALIVNPRPGKDYGAHAIILRNWRTLSAFFEQNRRALQSPDQLKEAIAAKRFLLQPVFPFKDED